MGRRNTSSYDDLFLEKTKAIFCKVIDNLNANKEIDYVEALTSRETMARWDDNGQSSAGNKTRWPVTFEQFVEHLDGQDQFVQDAAELLVSETIRTAIDKSLGDMVFAEHQRDFGLPILRSEVGCMVDHHQSRRVRRGVQRLTRANRRSNTLASVSSSSGSSSDDDSSTLDPEDFLPVTLPRAPSSVLPSQSRQSLPTRANAEDSMTMAEAEEIIERAEAAELAREEAREVSRRRSGRNLRQEREAAAGSAPRRATHFDNLATHSPPIRPLSTSQADVSTGALVQRFLAQPFLSEGRAAQRSSGSSGGSVLASLAARNRDPSAPPSAIRADATDNLTEGRAARRVAGSNDSGILASVGAMFRDPSRAPQAPRADALDQGQDRLQEFEAFASSRRYHRRPQSASDRVIEEVLQQSAAPGADSETTREDETFYRALGTLYQADETIRLVSQEAEEIDSAATTRRGGARRINLPSMSSSAGQRPVHRMPSRPRMRDDYHT